MISVPNRHLVDASETEGIGRALSKALPMGAFALGLAGPLGAGKSTLARGLLRGLGVSGPVPSPSYALVQPYECGRGAVYHVDLYRVRRVEEVRALGLEEALAAGGLVMVEWPERGAGEVMSFDLELHLDYADQGREFGARPLSESGRQTLERWQRQKT